MAAALQALAVRLPEGRLAREVVSLWIGLARSGAPASDRKWRFDAVEALLRHRLLPLPDLDAQIAEVGSQGYFVHPLHCMSCWGLFM